MSLLYTTRHVLFSFLYTLKYTCWKVSLIIEVLAGLFSNVFVSDSKVPTGRAMSDRMLVSACGVQVIDASLREEAKEWFIMDSLYLGWSRHTIECEMNMYIFPINTYNIYLIL